MTKHRSMTELVATTPGLFPLPDWAKDELSDLMGHQKSDLITGDEPEAVTAAYDEARADVITDQREAGLDLVVEGQLRWDDMLAHPLAVHDNVETRGIVRYYDNNNFYREPVVTGGLTPDGDVARELETAAELTADLQAILPGPYSLADLATDEHYGEEFLEAVASFLAAEADLFPAVESLWLLEPSLAVRPPDEGDTGRVMDAIETVAAGTDADVLVHTYWGTPEEATYTGLLDTDVAGIGLDLATDPEGAGKTLTEFGAPAEVALGLVDGQNTRVEDGTELRRIVDDVLESTPGGDIETAYLTTNTELFYLPVPRARDKLEALAEATTEAVRA